jgi:two-component system sensor histidine kinase FlrB
MSATTLETDAKRSELHAAFRAFGSVSTQLSDAFDALRGQVTQLRLELGLAQVDKANLAARLTALLNGLPGGVLVLDTGGVIVEANPAALQLLGAPCVGQRFAELLARAAVDQPAHAPGRARRPEPAHAPISGAAEQRELRSGRFINVSRRELPAGGDVVLLTDVTEAHLMQVFMTRQQRLLTLGELAAGLAHQIRTPLATALLYASQMTLADRSLEDLGRCAGKTVLSLKQLDRLVNDMLAFAHGGAARETVSVSALLEQVAQWVRPALRQGIRLTIRTEAPDLSVRANAPSLVSAVLNLATNALQAAGAEMELTLLARRSDEGRAQIIVSDDGPGIPAHLRERIFEPFFTTRACGNGIGLAIVKSVIEAHRGSVCLADCSRGATFIIDLPAEESP